MNKPQFDKPLYSIAEVSRYVGMPRSTFHSWARGEGTSRPAFITCLEPDGSDLRVPFVGLIEATVVRAFRQTGLPLQRIRRALNVLASQGELQHALASNRLYTDGADILYEYAETAQDRQLRLLTMVRDGQRVFHEVIDEYLKRIDFEDGWATSLILPVTDRDLLRVRPSVSSGNPVFIHGGAPLDAVLSRAQAGEPPVSIAADFDVPVEDISEVLNAFVPTSVAA